MTATASSIRTYYTVTCEAIICNSACVEFLAYLPARARCDSVVSSAAISRLPRNGAHPSMRPRTRNHYALRAISLHRLVRRRRPNAQNRRFRNDQSLPQRPFATTGSRTHGRRRGSLHAAAGAHELRASKRAVRPATAAAADGVLPRPVHRRGRAHLCPRACRARHCDRPQAASVRSDPRQGVRPQGRRDRDDGFRFAGRAARSRLLSALHFQHGRQLQRLALQQSGI